MKPIFLLIRPWQWVKNIFVLAPVFFGGKLLHLTDDWHVWLAFTCFCLASSAVYAMNDWFDRAHDALHPSKKNRPLASGALSPAAAIWIWLVLSITAVAGALWLPYPAAILITLYIFMQFLYSWRLKHEALLDVTIIAIGFELRVLIGGIATGIPVSNWLILMTFLLSLFLGFDKRRNDLLLAGAGKATRPSLDGYNIPFLQLATGVTTTSLIVCYILYTISEEVTHRIGSEYVFITSFFVIIGLLRYLQIVMVHQQQGALAGSFLKDWLLLLMGAGWLLSFGWLLYG